MDLSAIKYKLREKDNVGGVLILSKLAVFSNQSKNAKPFHHQKLDMRKGGR
jgi:hypothetical protein